MSSAYAPVDHPGVTVPVERRAWSTPWPHYRPVDITPPKLRPEALATPTYWVRDPQTDPTQIQDWDQRLERAVVPYRLDGAGWPLNPTGRTGRAGRNLKSWGENAAADPIVVAGTGADRSVLLIRRGDNGLWAIPGGMVEAGETVEVALTRELGEETGVDLTGHAPDAILRRGYVEDWRNSDHAWVCSTAALFLLPETVPAQGADDALEARWAPFTSVDHLVEDLAPHGGLYAAHIPLLVAAADHLGYHA